MKRTIVTLPALIARGMAVMMMIVSALPAFAQSTSPCAADIKEYCGRESPGGGRLLRCYEEQKDKMSAGCRAWAENAKTHATVVKEACSKTIDARCNFEKGDPLAVLECLQSNYVDLEVPCREKINLFKGMYPMPVK
jgi:hypothetical protein